MRCLVAAALSVLLVGCAPEPDYVLTLNAESSEATVVAEAERVLMARFGEFSASWFSSVESEARGSQIIFMFRYGAPDPSVIEYLYRTPGGLRVSIEGLSGELFDNRDIRDAVLRYADSTYRLALRLTPEAGARVMKATSENIGRVAAMTFDQEVLLESAITAPFGESLEITLPGRPSRFAELIAMLKSGALPTRVSAASGADGI